jgi:hypothetical protein
LWLQRWRVLVQSKQKSLISLIPVYRTASITRNWMVFRHTIRTVECVARRVFVKRGTVTCRKNHAERWTGPRALTSELLIGQWRRVCWQVQRPGSKRGSRVKSKLRFSLRFPCRSLNSRSLSHWWISDAKHFQQRIWRTAFAPAQSAPCSVVVRDFLICSLLGVTLVLCIESR